MQDTSLATSPTLSTLLLHLEDRATTQLNTYLQFSTELPLHEAMRYSTLNGGKRFRPLLVYLAGQALGLSLEQLDPIACAIEFIHCYSLVHDDLPAMDNADLRRGKASCHKQYNEATAILVGDALLTYAFEILASSPCLTDTSKVAMIQALAYYAGPEGAVKGQALDLAATEKQLSESDLRNLCHHKTGKLLIACVHLPCLIRRLNKEETAKLIEFAKCLGLAYQLQDDILDIESNTETLGKEAGIDKKNLKNTFPSVIGIQKTKENLSELKARALAQLAQLPYPMDTLVAFTDYLFKRQC